MTNLAKLGCLLLALLNGGRSYAQSATDQGATQQSAADAGSMAQNGDQEGGYRTAPDRQIGTYKIGLNLGRPDFDDGLNFYEETYGNVNWSPSLTVDWMPLTFWDFGLGMRFGLGVYKDKGKALIASSDGGEATYDQADAGTVNLTLIPITTAFNLTYAPFSGHYASIDFWAGMEWMYYQETRSSTSTDTATGSTTGSTSTSMLSRSGSSIDASGFALGGSLSDLANRKWKQNSVMGASVNILLNWLDQRSAASMRGALGLGYIYLSPFLQITRALEKDGASFGRTEYGLSFRFESVL